MFRVSPILSLLLLMTSASPAQSLGDVARQNREKQKAKTTTASRKIVTNDDLPAGPVANADRPKQEEKKEASPLAPAGKLSAAQWKTQILAQKNAVASLQAQIDALNNSIHFVQANLYYNGAQYNEYQVKKQKQVAQMQQQLEEQKQRLAEMQEQARQAGMGNAVYDP